ncbi:MAG: hypothetical protein WCA22_20370 [Candidatus Binatus sp.]
MGSTAALAIVSKLAPLIIDAMAPEVQSLLKSLPGGLLKLAPPPLDVEVAVAANIAKAMPAVTAATLATLRNKIGAAVAIYATEHPGDNLESQACWVDIAAAASAGIAAEGLEPAQIPSSTYWQMILSGLELYRAGLGARALTVAA